jgi:hypothetical protein
MLFGLASGPYIALMLVLSVGFGLLLSLAAVLMEERAFRRYPGWRCLGRLLLASVAENLLYRQFMTFVRARSLLTVRRSKGTWGDMTRVGFGPAAETAAADPPAAA